MKTLYQFLKKDLKPNINQTAFFFGNGLNNYCKTTNSWNQLLIELANKHINNTDDYEKILKDNSVSYPEFFDLIQLASNARDETFDYKSIKRNIKQGFEKWKAQKNHAEWTELFIRLNRPVLTTNYDYLLEFSNESIKSFMRSKQYNKKLFRPCRFKGKEMKAGFTPFYPWHSYYSNQVLKNANNEFAIWHIHGFYEYASSIRLGLSDYMGMVEKARRWLNKSKGSPFTKGKEANNWVGNNSWLDVFLNNNLLIVGLSLDVQETALRWLLIEREKLYRRNRDARKKTWFVINKQHDKLEQGKRLFLQQLNIELIEAENSKQIYETAPKHIDRLFPMKEYTIGSATFYGYRPENM